MELELGFWSKGKKKKKKKKKLPFQTIGGRTAGLWSFFVPKVQVPYIRVAG